MATNDVKITGAEEINYYFRNYSYAGMLSDLPILSLGLATDLDRLVYKNASGTTPFKIMLDASTTINLTDDRVMVTTNGGRANISAVTSANLLTLTGISSNIQEQINNLHDDDIDSNETGWVSGGVFTKTAAPSANIIISTNMVIKIVDRTGRTIKDDPFVPAGTVVPTGMAPNELKYCFVDLNASGEFSYYWFEIPTDALRRKYAQVGRAWMDAAGNVSGVGDYVDPAWEMGESFKTTMYLSSICRVSEGNVYSLHSTNMTMQKTSGSDFRMAVYAKEYIAGTNDSPNEGTEAAVSEFTDIIMMRRDLPTLTHITSIPTTQYELNGVLTDLSNNKYGYILVFHAVKSNLCLLQLGTEEYGSLEAAKAGFDADTYTYSPVVKNACICKGIIAFQKDVASPTSVDIEFTPLNFVPGLGGAGGASGSETYWSQTGTVVHPTTITDTVSIGTSESVAKFDLRTSFSKNVAQMEHIAFVGTNDTANPLGFDIGVKGDPIAANRHVHLDACEHGLDQNRGLILQRHGGKVGIGNIIPNNHLDIYSAAGTPLGLQRSGAGQIMHLTDGVDTFGLYNRAGSPEGQILADVGSRCIDTAVGALYIKKTDTVNTGWSLVSTPWISSGSNIYFNNNIGVGAGMTNPGYPIHVKQDPIGGTPWVGQVCVDPQHDDKDSGISIKTSRGTDRVWSILAGGGTDIENFIIRDSTASNANRLILDKTGKIDIPGIYTETTTENPNVYIETDGSLRRSLATPPVNTNIFNTSGTCGAGRSLGLTDTLNVGGGTLYLNDANNAVGVNTTTPYANGLTIDGGAPHLYWYDSAETVDERLWDFLSYQGIMRFRAVNDANTLAEEFLQVTRSSYNIGAVRIPNGTFEVPGIYSATTTDPPNINIATNGSVRRSTASAIITLYNGNGTFGAGRTGVVTDTLNFLGGGTILSGTAKFQTVFRDTSNRGIFTGFDSSGQVGILGAYGTEGELAFWSHDGTSWGERIRINKLGRIGFGTVDPKNKVDISGGAVIGSSLAGVSTAPTNGLVVEGFTGIGTVVDSRWSGVDSLIELKAINRPISISVLNDQLLSIVNAYCDGGIHKMSSSGTASMVSQSYSEIDFLLAESGVADSTINWKTEMSITSTGTYMNSSQQDRDYYLYGTSSTPAYYYDAGKDYHKFGSVGMLQVHSGDVYNVMSFGRNFYLDSSSPDVYRRLVGDNGAVLAMFDEDGFAIKTQSDANVPANSIISFATRLRVTEEGDVYSVKTTDYFSTSTMVGWSSPTGKILYRTIGKTVYVRFNITGTSNSAITSFTLPFTSANDDVMSAHGGRGIDNSVTLTNPILIYIPPNSNILTLYTNFIGTSLDWTASNSKTVQGEIFYEMA